MANILREMSVTAPIAIIPNGVELHLFYKAEPQLRADFGFTPDDILLIYTGRLATEKNLMFLLQAFAGVAQALDNVYLVVVGGGQKQIEAEIREITTKLKIDERVRFIGMVNVRKIAFLPCHVRCICHGFGHRSSSAFLLLKGWHRGCLLWAFTHRA